MEMIDLYTKSLIRMEYKLRRLYEEYDGDPPKETVMAYERIMEVDARNRERLISATRKTAERRV